MDRTLDDRAMEQAGSFNVKPGSGQRLSDFLLWECATQAVLLGHNLVASRAAELAAAIMELHAWKHRWDGLSEAAVG